MALTTAQIQAAYVTFFSRPADVAGLAYWSQYKGSIADLYATFAQSAEYADAFSGLNNGAKVALVYQNMFGRAPEVAGLNYWTLQLDTGAVTVANLALALANGAQGTDLETVENRTAAATAFTAALDQTAEILGYSGAEANGIAKAWLAGVTTDASLAAAVETSALDAGIATVTGTGEEAPVAGQAYSLTTALDVLAGNSGNDQFVARVVQNANGEQTNQLATGDQINGGGGVDTLNAKVQTASALNSFSPASAIAPETVDVEVANFTALDAEEYNFVIGGGGDNTVVINAKFMNGLDRVASVQSDVSLVIQNLNTLTDTGVYAERRLTESMTVRMDHTGNGEQVDDAADLTVLFDQNYLRKRGDVQSGATMTIELMDMDSALTGGDPLEDNPYGQITFDFAGVRKSLIFGTEAKTYEELEEAVIVAIEEAGKIDPIFKQLSVTRVANGFTASDTDGLPGGSATGDTIVITNSGPEVLVARSMVATGEAPAGKDFHTNFDDTPPGSDGFLITVNVELEKVGRGADGGNLTVGAMSTEGNSNDYFAGEQYKSVEQFDVTVSGDATQWSSVASMQSTNNRLQVVNVVNVAGSQADLIIGNTETVQDFGLVNGTAGVSYDLSSARNAALKDVRTFDSTAFANDVTLHAHVSDETQAKYLNEVDKVDDATADNVVFNYSFGGGNDTLNINVDKSNLTMDNSSVSEDFVLNVNMGSGNDRFQGQLGDGAVNAGDNWYANLVVNAEADDTPTELSVAAGAGDDTIEVWASGRWNIDAGTGNDAIYSDNSGRDATYNKGRAVWVLNVDGTDPTALDIDNLRSEGIDNNGALYRSFVSVSLRGYESAEVQITGYNSTDTDLNNAIKRAIAQDEHLSHLLVAEDGPAGTLVIRSLVDSDFVAADFGFSLRAPTAAEFGVMSSAQLQGFNAANGLTAANAAAALAAVQGDVAAFNAASPDYASVFAKDGGADLAGADSEALVSNVIEAGNGDDTLSLSTNAGPDAEFETVNVADTEVQTAGVEDLVFNATNAVITFDADDLIITSTGLHITTTTSATVVVEDGIVVEWADAAFGVYSDVAFTGDADDAAVIIGAETGAGFYAVEGADGVVYVYAYTEDATGTANVDAGELELIGTIAP